MLERQLIENGLKGVLSHSERAEATGDLSCAAMLLILYEEAGKYHMMRVRV